MPQITGFSLIETIFDATSIFDKLYSFVIWIFQFYQFDFTMIAVCCVFVW